MLETLEIIRKTHRNILITSFIFTGFLLINFNKKYEDAIEQLNYLEALVNLSGKNQPADALELYYKSQEDELKEIAQKILPAKINVRVYHKKYTPTTVLEGYTVSILEEFELLLKDNQKYYIFPLPIHEIENGLKNLRSHYSGFESKIESIELFFYQEKEEYRAEIEVKFSSTTPETLTWNIKYTPQQMTLPEIINSALSKDENNDIDFPIRHSASRFEDLNYFLVDSKSDGYSIAATRRKLIDLQIKESTTKIQDILIPVQYVPYLLTVLIIVQIIHIASLLLHILPFADTHAAKTMSSYPWIGFFGFPSASVLLLISFFTPTVPLGIIIIYSEKYNVEAIVILLLTLLYVLVSFFVFWLTVSIRDKINNGA